MLGSDMGLITVLDRPMRAVSTGQAKRALLARAMIAEPKLLAVDELGQGLDRRGRFQLLDSLERIAVSGRTRLLVSGQGCWPCRMPSGGASTWSTDGWPMALHRSGPHP